MTLVMGSTALATPPSAIGQRVAANSTVNVRSSAAGSVVGTQTSGSQGGVIAGPVTATLSGTSYVWWQINFDSGVDGWVASIGIDVVAGPTVTVSSPNGGENWTAGSARTISWSISGTTSQINYQHVALSTDGGSTFTNISPSSGLAATARTFSWTPTTASTSCRIRVRAMDVSGNILAYDVSDANFTVSATSTPPTVTVSSPNGGENWTAGSARTISWSISGTTSQINYQHVALSTDGGSTFSNISPSSGLAATDRTFSWTPTTASTSCRIRVRAMDVSGNILAYDVSDANFTVSATSTPPTVTVSSPNGGENWTAGSARTISWSISGTTSQINYQHVALSTDGGSTFSNISPSSGLAATDRTFSWTPTTASTSCRIRVRAMDALANILAYDVSDANFTVSATSTPPTVTVSSPNGGENWTTGSVRTISWGITGTTSQISYQHVALSTDGGSTFTNISPSSGLAATDRTFSWTPTTASTSCRIRVRAMDALANILAYDVSDANFTVSGTNTGGLACPVPSYGSPYTAPVSAIFDHNAAAGWTVAFTGAGGVGTNPSIPTNALAPMNYLGTASGGSATLNYDGHAGTDFKVPSGVTVVAAANGIVEATAEQVDGAGFYVKIRHDALGIRTLYMHLSKDTFLVSPGQSVQKGQSLALSGNTGNTTGPHLHFEVRKIGGSSDIPVDPYGWTGVGADPYTAAVNQNLWENVGGNSDTTLPRILAFSPASSSVTVGSTATLSFQVSDAGGSGLSRVELRRTSGDGTAYDPGWQKIAEQTLSGNGPVSGTFTDVPPGPGTVYYGLYVLDGAGNGLDERAAGVGPDAVTVLPAGDTQAPVVSIVTPAEGASLTSAALVAQGTATDNVGVTQVEYRLNGGGWLVANGTTSWSASVDLAQGTNTLRARATDAAGNVSSIALRTFSYQPPQPGMLDISPQTVDVPAAGTSQSVTVRNLGQTSFSWQATSDSSWLYAAPAAGTLAPGASAELTLSIEDYAGFLLREGRVEINAPTATNGTQWIVVLQQPVVDQTSPTLTVESPAPDFHTTSAALTIAGSASDDRALAAVEWRTASGTWASLGNTSPWSASVSLAEGVTLLEFRARDVSGNVSDVVQRQVTRLAAGYDAWAWEKGLPAGRSGPLDNADTDALNNLLEYALGTDPTSMTPDGGPILSRIAGASPVDDLLDFRFSRVAARSDLIYEVQVSHGAAFAPVARSQAGGAMTPLAGAGVQCFEEGPASQPTVRVRQASFAPFPTLFRLQVRRL